MSNKAAGTASVPVRTWGMLKRVPVGSGLLKDLTM